MSAFQCTVRAGEPLRFARAARAVVLVLMGVIAGAAGSPAAAKSLFPTPLVQAEADAVRLLEQATFGPNDASIQHVMDMGAVLWVEQQLSMAPTRYTAFTPWPSTRPDTCVNDSTLPLTPTSYCQRDNYSLFQLQREFFVNALTAPDQLRQRVAFALSQILVTSGTEISLAYAMQRYQQILSDLAFGNFRDILTQVTLSPAMGRYLDMVNNLKPNTTTGVEPNENYAREFLQLFSLGTVELGPDGTPLLDSYGKTIAAYSQEDVEGFAHVFTGWTYPVLAGQLPRTHNPKNFLGDMAAVASNHDTGAKQLLDDAIAPAGLAMDADLAGAIRNVFLNPNIAPFVSRQLIQKLVTGDPSPQYVARVAAAFVDNGHGVRGDMKSVVRAILTDPEARGPVKLDPAYGKLREPALLREKPEAELGQRVLELRAHLRVP